MKKRRFTKWVMASAAVLGMLAFAPASLAAEPEEGRVLRVAFPESTGINEVYEDGTYGGCTYDWLHEVSKYTGWKYEFVTGDPGELVEGMMAGEYDLMGGMFYQKEYEEMLCYPKYVMGSNYSLLIYPREDSTIKSFDYKTLDEKRIGVFQKAAAKIERLKKFLDFNGLHCELVLYENTEDYESCLERGEVDLLYGSDIYMKEHYNVAAKIEGEPYYLVTAGDEQELCEQLTQAMNAVYSANPDFSKDLYDRYFPDKYLNVVHFTQEEKEFASNRAPLRVAIVKDRFPVYYTEEGVEKGIVPTCLGLLSDSTGLTFTYVFADSYQELLTLVQEGKADIAGCFMNDDVSADALGLVRTVPFAELDAVILRNKLAASDRSLTMAVPVGRDVKPENTGDTIAYYETYEECLAAVNRGKADYMELPAAFAQDLYAKDYYPNVILLADTDHQEELTFALTEPVDAMLYSILNKGINNFSQTELDGIISRNVLMGQKDRVTLKTLLYTNPALVISVCVGLVMLICLILLLVVRYKMKSRVMRMKLEKAEDTSRAKSEFLSRMSHEIRTPMNAIIGLTNLAILSEDAGPAVRDHLSKIESSAKFLLSLLNDILDMAKIENDKMELESKPFDLQEVIDQLKDMFTLQAEQKGIKLIFSGELEGRRYLGDGMRLGQVLANLLSNACKFTEKGGSVQLAVSEKEETDGTDNVSFCVKDTGIGIREEDLERIFRSFEQADNKGSNMPGTGLGLSISRSLVQLMGGELEVKSSPGEGSEFYFTIALPRAAAKSPQEPSAPDGKKTAPDGKNPALAGTRILLAEDNDVNAEIAIELLALQQAAVERAKDGQEAVEFFAAHPQEYYDAVLMDITMPVKDGLTASREIRAMERADAGTVPILAMTANTLKEDRDKAFEAGMNGFLPKPFDVEQLFEALQTVIAAKGQ